MKHGLLVRNPANAVLLTLLSVGCGSEQLSLERRVAHRPPETTLSSTPTDSPLGVNYRVHLWWSGSDSDGTVDHFDFILVDHPASTDHLDPREDVDPIEVPDVDDPRWQTTSAFDSVFITLADTLRSDPQPDDSTSAEEIRNRLLDRWHTFFIRAVDDDGLVDPTPDYVSFNSTNLAPRVWLTSPVEPGRTVHVPSVARFTWDGEDPVGDGDTIEPVAARWVLIDSQIDADGGPSAFPDSLYTLQERYAWSPWASWSASDQSGREAIRRNLQKFQVLESGRVVGYYLFAVQALDEAGARTLVFDRHTPYKNNVVSVMVDQSPGPVLYVLERSTGLIRFVESETIVADVAAGQPLRFSWLADGVTYGARSYQYRYAWDLIDASRPENWDQDWCEDCTVAAPRSFDGGSHTFVLQARDDLGLSKEARYVIQMHALTGERDVLLVDDTRPRQPGSDQEVREDARWLTVLTALGERGVSFDPAQDVYDVAEHRFESPTIEHVFRYKSVIWSVREVGASSALRRLAQFVDPFLERNANASTHNYLVAYLENGGKVWINGDRPARNLWPRLSAEQLQRPVNVTNWDDDPLERHPGIDSVGTLSLLYAMGVQMFECGAGTGCRRDTPEQLCLGLQRAVPQGSEIRTFRTETIAQAPHTHLVEIRSTDVEGGAGDYRFSTWFSLDHRHDGQMTQEDLERLRGGATLRVITDEATEPFPHAHAVLIHDDLGLWGVPFLNVGADWSADASGRRPDVEIYNMPGAMASSQPRLLPRPGTYVPLYTFVSGVPQDPNRGIFYPLTADKQPVAILAKGNPEEPLYSRAFLGVEPEALDLASHQALAEFLLIRHFQLGMGSAP